MRAELPVRSDAICALMRDALARHARVEVRVWGGSMRPFVRPGTLVTVEACAFEDLAIGDIAAFERNGSLVLHRVVSRDRRRAVTRGDSLREHDAPIGDREHLGRIAGVVLGSRTWPNASRRSSRVVGFGSLVVARLTRWGFVVARARRRR